MNPLSKALQKAKGGVKKVEDFFIGPSLKVNALNSKADAINKVNAKSGSFNGVGKSAKPSY